MTTTTATPIVWIRNLSEARNYGTEAIEGFGMGAECEARDYLGLEIR